MGVLGQMWSNQFVEKFGKAGSVVKVKGDAVVGQGCGKSSNGSYLPLSAVPGRFRGANTFRFVWVCGGWVGK